MIKYCIKYNDFIFHGIKKEHKKLKLYHYLKYVESSPRGLVNIMLFDTSFQAKLWIIKHSSLPKAADYITTINSEELADKIIAKGKYILSRAFIKESALISNSNNLFKHCYDTVLIPMLCELIVDEYEL